MVQRHHIAVLLSWPLVATAISLVVGPAITMFGSILLFLGVPAALLSYWERDKILKSALFTAIIVIPGTTVVDYIAEASGTWFISTIFPVKFLGLITVEAYLWSFFTVYYIVMFYEHVLEHHKAQRVMEPRMKYLVLLLFSILPLAVAVFLHLPQQLSAPYYYLLLGLSLVVVPVLIEVIEFPRIRRKLLIVGGYFAFAFLLYELTALHLGLWTFPGDGTVFVDWISFFGIRFPVEELVFYVLMTSMVFTTYYDYWDDYKDGEF